MPYRAISSWLLFALWLQLSSLAIQTYARTVHLSPRQFSILGENELASIAALSPTEAQGGDILDYHVPTSALAKILVPRAVGSQNLTRVQNVVKDYFKDISTSIPRSSESASETPLTTWELFEDTFDATTPYGIKSFSNLVFTHDPSAQRKFVIAAHLDSKYFPSAPQNGFVGATDSAVPCGIMLDIASTLNDMLNALVEKWESREKPADGLRTTVQMIFFDGEEAFKQWTNRDSIYGARHLAEVWSHPSSTPSPVTPQSSSLSSIDVLVLLDLIGVANPIIRNFYTETGWLYDAFVSVESRLGESGLLWEGEEGQDWDRISISRSRRIFEIRNNDMQIYSGRIEDDHLPFLERGVPILHLIPVPFPHVWHTLADDASALDLPTIRAWATILRVITAEYLGLSPAGVTPQNSRDFKDELASLHYHSKH